ncbi:hypothetical protein G7B40_021495 [Aetokthonos hydrillicola Thurmond2011]|jgi:hypothetical protein|uniref:Uncharacterized protein n=1 Tax=Aetokthonos hydrillicola Thurmond2011 TaxID=2712845 RepID=A0AAP5I9G8_9CYAN|nr:hypothetical protein [Aetokthonos hydrillicola]MBO3457745.1 hypothetical protein [Aetokthonos hydrillicola CCALA 1050]MBW4589404.1 hypothetical protein [Aetokthonos hydrillicola CCALA 1050]MDR9897119.1 hypothetical protein [Aetokthonos hydrillicola Thurmond2011]
MSTEVTPDPVRQTALAALTASFEAQGHPTQYAQAIATSIIFQTDLDLRNAQLSRLLAWLKQEHNNIYASALEVTEKTREEFEKRVQQG